MMRRRPLFALCLVAGLSLTAAQAPYGLWVMYPLGLICALAAARAIYHHATRSAFKVGWLIGLIYFGTSLTWITEPFFVDMAAHGWMAPFALLFMAGGLALFWGAAFWGMARLGHWSPLLALWPLADYARSTVLTGFPWGLLSYGWLDTPLAQGAAILGPHGLGLLTVCLCTLPFVLGRIKGSAAMLLCFAALWIGLPSHDGQAPDTDRPIVRLTQPNAPQHLKWDREHIPIYFRRQLDFTGAAPTLHRAPDLILWPETSLPSWLNDAEPVLGAISEAAQDAQVVVGAQRYELGSRDVFNTLALVSPGGAVTQTYDKYHLVPFGEYLPLQSLMDRIGLSALADLNGGGFAAGPGPALLDLGPLGKALPLICYEAVFPHQMHAGADRADMIIHITNDAWFGTRAGPHQHLAQARFRAIEQGLPVLRAANTGVSAVISARGAVLSSIPLGEAGFIDAAVPAPLPPTLYAKTGDWPTLLSMVLLVFATVLAHRRRSY